MVTLKRSKSAIKTLSHSSSLDIPRWSEDQPGHSSAKDKKLFISSHVIKTRVFRLLTRSVSVDITEEEEEEHAPTPLLRDIIIQLRRYSETWFRVFPCCFCDIVNPLGNC